MMDFSALNEISQSIVGLVETVVSLAALHAGVSIITVFTAVWVMQAMTRAAGLSSRRARPLLARRVTIGCLAVALAFNAATPLITPDPPWLSDVPVVFAITMLLIIIGLLHRIQSELQDGRRTGTCQRPMPSYCANERGSSTRRPSTTSG